MRRFYGRCFLTTAVVFIVFVDGFKGPVVFVFAVHFASVGLTSLDALDGVNRFDLG